MGKNKGNTYRVALGGLLTAAAVAVMFLGSVIPFATFAVPAISSLTILYFSLEYGKRFALLVYIAISTLSLLLIPDKEIAFLFALFFGHYPILKGVFENVKNKLAGWIFKFLAFNASILIIYWLLTSVFVSEMVLSEFAGYTKGFLIVLLLAGNLAFLLFDIALTRLISMYLFRIRPKLNRRR